MWFQTGPLSSGSSASGYANLLAQLVCLSYDTISRVMLALRA